MSTHKHIDKICLAVLAIVILITVCLMNGEFLGLQANNTTMAYEKKLFDTSKVHTIDIIMDDWDSFIESAQNEEYAPASVVINNEAYKNVGIRAKGNSSLSSVASSNSNRYSFKIEFDHYENKSYYGLDKLSLNNIIQDNTYMKDFLTYQMMDEFGVASPLTSYVYITVNGEDWGLYLAVEGVEDSFLTRNYGNDSGNLYKPDSMDMGGGRGNGKDFNWDSDFFIQQKSNNTESADPSSTMNPDPPNNFDPSMFGENGFDPSTMFGENGFDPSTMFGENGFDPPTIDGENGRNGFGGMGGMFGMGSSDVKLQYTDDDPDSYPNIFDNAKTDITEDDMETLIASLKQLSEGSSIDEIVNVDQVIRYFVVHNFVLNFDSYTGSIIHNYYLYEDDGVLSMIPWDYNLAFGGFQSTSNATSLANYPIDSPVSNGTTEDRPIIHWIFSKEEYTELYHQYFSEFLDMYFASGHFESLIDDTIALISPYVEKDPTKFCTYEEFQTAANTLKEFVLLREESIRGQLDGTIPSTSTGQSADSSSLIDASSLSISSMGSMGDMGGRRPGKVTGNAKDKAPDNQSTSPNGNTDGNRPSMPYGNTDGNKPSIPNGNTNGSRPNMPSRSSEDNFPSMNKGNSENNIKNNISHRPILISLCTLILGLGVAIWYKR